MGIGVLKMKVVKLPGIVPRLEEYDPDDEMVIFMRLPWSIDAPCVVVPAESSKSLVEPGFSYFLEVAVAREVLEGYSASDLDLAGLCHRLIYYAENDAYMD